jgi:hypothetical protein
LRGKDAHEEHDQLEHQWMVGARLCLRSTEVFLILFEILENIFLEKKIETPRENAKVPGICDYVM